MGKAKKKRAERDHHVGTVHRLYIFSEWDGKTLVIFSLKNWHNVCVPCYWIRSKSWWPYEWVIPMFCPQQPWSALADSCLWLFLWNHPSHFRSFSFPDAFYFFRYFRKNPVFSWCAQSETALVLSFFASRDVSGLICSKAHLFIFLVDQGIHKSLLQHHLSSESIFLSSLYTSPTSASTGSNWEFEDVDDLILGL